MCGFYLLIIVTAPCLAPFGRYSDACRKSPGFSTRVPIITPLWCYLKAMRMTLAHVKVPDTLCYIFVADSMNIASCDSTLLTLKTLNNKLS